MVCIAICFQMCVPIHLLKLSFLKGEWVKEKKNPENLVALYVFGKAQCSKNNLGLTLHCTVCTIMFVVSVNFSESQISYLGNGAGSTCLPGVFLGLEILFVTPQNTRSVCEDVSPVLFSTRSRECVVTPKPRVLWLWFRWSASFAAVHLDAPCHFLQ